MSPEKAKICIIDDTQVVIEGLQRIFEASGHRVLLTAQTKEGALEAIDQFRQHKIDVVLLDTNLVYDDHGFKGKAAREVLEKIRSVAPNVKVITMSGGEPLEGGDVKMHKSFSGKQLLDVVNNL